MSEREQFEGMLRRAGVPFSVDPDPSRRDPQPGEVTLRIKQPGGYDSEQEVPAVSGYGGFYCDWTFDAQGRLVQVGIWE